MAKGVGLGYVKIHACENDCILFWKEHAKKDVCPKCDTSRWKSENSSPCGKHVHRVPRKVLRYFPIKRKGYNGILCAQKQQVTQGGMMKDAHKMVC